MKTIKIGVIGLGCRGSELMENVLLHSPGVVVTGVCDDYEDRTKKAADTVQEQTGVRPFETTDYKAIINSPDNEAVVISAAWEAHIPLAIEAMRAGKAVAMEVGGAYTIQDCFDLVDAWEATRVPFMLMENCCFDRYELLATSMARAGLFGRIVHCEGAYSHDLREEISYGDINRHYRLRNYIARNCENYPTHELGPIAKLLHINRGNRMLGLVCASSGAFGLHEYIHDREELSALKDQKFSQGDMFHTLITCENGETILLRLDTTLPRFYTRNFTVRGTKGLYEMNTNTVFFDGASEEDEYYDPLKSYTDMINNAAVFEEKYLPDFWKNITPEEENAGHGGMDYFEFKAFFDALREGREMPVDVYDAASWMAVTCLTAESIKNHGSYVEIPDFTRGAYKNRAPEDVVPL